MINASMLLRLRERGLVIEGGEFATPRLAEIAKRQNELMNEMNRLDEEIVTLAKAQPPPHMVPVCGCGVHAKGCCPFE